MSEFAEFLKSIKEVGPWAVTIGLVVFMWWWQKSVNERTDKKEALYIQSRADSDARADKKDQTYVDTIKELIVPLQAISESVVQHTIAQKETDRTVSDKIGGVSKQIADHNDSVQTALQDIRDTKNLAGAINTIVNELPVTLKSAVEILVKVDTGIEDLTQTLTENMENFGNGVQAALADLRARTQAILEAIIKQNAAAHPASEPEMTTNAPERKTDDANGEAEAGQGVVAK